ncbi:hypothetical protein MBLNU13_g00361t1 [Cladosporium sp. NU13]
MPFFLHPLFLFFVAAHIHGKVDFDKRDTIASRSPAFDSEKVSATINDAVAKAGFDADEAEAIRAGYHVAVDQFDDSEDESRKLMSDVLLKVLDDADVEKVGDALDVLGEKFDGLVPRDVDTTAGSKDDVKTEHIIVTDSSNDLASRDVPTVFEIMATMTQEEGHSGKGPIPGIVKDGHDEHGGRHDKRSSQPEERQEATDHAGPEPVELVKKFSPTKLPEPVDEENVRPTPTEVLASHPFLAQFMEMGLLDNPDAPRAATAEDVGRILVLLSNPNSTKIPGSNSNLTDSDYARLNFLERLKEMGLLKQPKGKRIMTIEEVFQSWQDYSLKAKADRNTTLPSTAIDAPEKVQEKIPLPDYVVFHSKRSVPEVPGCDCQSTIDAVKEPKPEGGMTYEWFQHWKYKDVNPKCIRPCVDKAIDHFDETVRKYQAFEEQFGGMLGAERQPPKTVPGISKRNEPVDLSKPAEADVPTVKNEPPKSVNGITYRDWYKMTQETGEFCTCHMQSPSMWYWVLSFYGKSQRCIKFCSQSVEPFLKKEKEALPVPQEPSTNATAVEEPVVDSPPSGEKRSSVVSVPVTYGPKGVTQPEQDAPGNANDEQ